MLVILQVSLVAGFLEKWEKDDDAHLIIIKVCYISFVVGLDS